MLIMDFALTLVNAVNNRPTSILTPENIQV
jgi:hypothetical protein